MKRLGQTNQFSVHLMPNVMHQDHTIFLLFFFLCVYWVSPSQHWKQKIKSKALLIMGAHFYPREPWGGTSSVGVSQIHQRPRTERERKANVNQFAGKIRNVRIHPPYPKDLPAGQIWSLLTLFWEQQALCCINQPGAPVAFALEQRDPPRLFPWKEHGDFQVEFWSLKFPKFRCFH